MIRRRTLVRDLAATRREVAILRAVVADHDRRLRQLEGGDTWPVNVAEFGAHVTHDDRGVEVIR
jgi:hypothetical protein